MITTHTDRGMRRLIQQVAECIDREPLPDVYCDACLALHMQISLAEATEATVHVAGLPGFNVDDLNAPDVSALRSSRRGRSQRGRLLVEHHTLDFPPAP